MRRLVPLVALVLLAACGTGSDEGLRSEPDPRSPSAAPSTATRTPFGFDVAFRQDDPSSLVVRYGDSSSCPHEQVDAEVSETATEVRVTLTALAPGTQACTDDYGARDVTLALQQPLAERVVVDGSTGEPVAVAVGDPPGPPGSPVPLPSR